MVWPSAENLNNLNLSTSVNRIPSGDSFKEYFDKPAGVEHYRLLTWLGFEYFNKHIVEVGVYKGLSGCALSTNITNSVTGFDVVDNITCDLPENYTVFFGNVLQNERIIKKASLILYDTNHDGVLEKQFYDWLKQINYKGLIIFDDIYLNNEMKEFWNYIDCKKEDISHIGHITGTGAVWM